MAEVEEEAGILAEINISRVCSSTFQEHFLPSELLSLLVHRQVQRNQQNTVAEEEEDEKAEDCNKSITK